MIRRCSDWHIHLPRKVLFMQTYHLLFTLAVQSSLFALAAASWADELRTWTGADGKFKVEAELLETAGDTVHLRTADGSMIRVPLASISEADRAHVERASKERFVLPGVLSIANPSEGFAWKVVKEVDLGGVKGTVLLCSKEGSESRMVLSIEHRKTPTDAHKVAALKGHYNGLIQTLEGAGIKIQKGAQPSLNTPVPKGVPFALVGQKPDGTQMEVYGITVFGENVYGFQIFNCNRSEADRLAKVVDTLTEIARAEKSPTRTH